MTQHAAGEPNNMIRMAGALVDKAENVMNGDIGVAVMIQDDKKNSYWFTIEPVYALQMAKAMEKQANECIAIGQRNLQ
jgi:ATP-dependent exoDNAse (exonuclease V) alpha subunit